MRTIFLLSLLALAGCRPFVKVLYGVKNPKVENESTLTQYLSKKGMNPDNVVALDFQAYPPTLEMIGNAIPEVLIFDAEGRYIPYGDEWACNASAFDFIEKLHADSTYATRSTPTLEQALSGLTDLQGNPFVLQKTDPTEFFILIYWASWAGKLNKDHVQVWEQQALGNSRADIRVLKVNMDLQEFWGPENLDKIGMK